MLSFSIYPTSSISNLMCSRIIRLYKRKKIVSSNESDPPIIRGDWIKEMTREDSIKKYFGVHKIEQYRQSQKLLSSSE